MKNSKLIALVLLCYTLSASAQKIILADNLQQDGALAKSDSKVILLMFEGKNCSYCDLMKSDLLEPMLIQKDKLKAIIRRIRIDSTDKLIDFSGNATDMLTFANKNSIRVTPTLLFLDPQGEERAKRMIGISTKNFLSYYIDKKIDKVITFMQKNHADRK